MEKKTKRKIRVYELIWIFLSLLTITSVGLLCFGLFTPLLALVISLVITCILLLVFKASIVLKDLRFNWIIIGIVIIGLVMRLSPWMYLEGGQDQGVYIAMSKQFAINNGLTYSDNVLEDLTGEAKNVYENERGWYMAGLQRNDEGKLFIDFYPAHPALMSVFGYLLGDMNSTYELTLFSVLSIIGIYLLTVEVSGKKSAGYIVAGLIALSPLHLYFSKFPVAEVPAMAIFINSLYFLIRAYKSGKWEYLGLVLLLINMFFYLKMTWIISAPFYVLSIFAVLLYSKKKQEKINWSIFGIGIIISYLISSFFYFKFQNSLYVRFYGDIFDYIPEVIYYALWISLPIIFYILTVPLNLFMKKIISIIYRFRVWIAVLILLIITGYAVKIFYTMAFTTKYLGSIFDYFWGMANKGWFVLKDMPYTSLTLYLTPVGIAIYLLSLRKIDTPQKALLTFLLLTYLGFNIIETRFVAYHYYYARYQLSEIIPLAYIFISIFLSDLFDKKRILFYILFIPMITYNAFFSLFIYQGFVGTSPSAYQDIKKEVGDNSVVVFYNPSEYLIDSFVLSPLKYYFDVPTVYTEKLETIEIYRKGIEKDVYLLTSVPVENKKYNKIKDITVEKRYYASVEQPMEPYSWKISNYQLPYCKNYIPEKYCSGIIPIRYHTGELHMYLYKLIK